MKLPHRRRRALAFAGGVLSLLFAAGASAAPQEPLWPDREEIELFLKKARVTAHHKIGAGVTHPEEVTLEQDGVVREAVFKDIDETTDSWRNELAAYGIDKLLGIGMVPPTVRRSIGGRQGSLQLWVTGSTLREYDGGFPDLAGWRDQVSVMWLFDDLIANVDRHLNNGMVSPERRLILIDNSRSFRDMVELRNNLNAKFNGTNARYFGVTSDADRGPFPVRYPRPLIERLRSVTDKEIKDAVGRYVSGWRQHQLLERRKRILERLDAMGPAVLFDVKGSAGP
jgi:hypothetical protein